MLSDMVHSSREHCLLSLSCLGRYMAPVSLAESACLRDNYFCCTDTIFARRRGLTAKTEITQICYYSSRVFFSMILWSLEEFDYFLSALTDRSAKCSSLVRCVWISSTQMEEKPYNIQLLPPI